MVVAATISQIDMDPVTFEVIRNSLVAACNEMALVVAKTAYSTPVNEGRDFAGTIYDSTGRLVAQGEFDLPGFVGVTLLTVPAVLDEYGLDYIADGDIYMLNDPYVAAGHCNDIHLIKPIFIDDKLSAFVSSTAHWSDVGGAVPGSLNPHARTQFEEGVRIPAVPVYRRGVLNDPLLRVLLANMRGASERVGDFRAQVAALAAGEARVKAIAERHGTDALSTCMAAVQDYSERLMRLAITELPDGTYFADDEVDQDLATGEPKSIRLKLTIESDHLIFDLTESDTKALSGINCTIAATTSAVFIGLAAMMPAVPVNAGVMRAVELLVRKDSILWAQPPSAISGLTSTCMEEVVAVTINCLSQAAPGRGAACAYSIMNGVFAGDDDRPGFGTTYVNYAWGFGGLGGTKGHDGVSGVSSPFASSSTNIPCELQERRYPVMFWGNTLIPDSGGAGSSRGGLAVEQLITFTANGGTFTSLGNRERIGPPGIFGGHDGGKAHLLISNPETDEQRNAGIYATNIPVAPGDVISIWSSGGGGYGDPLDRSEESVVEDIKDDYISIQASRDIYGVVVREIDRRRLVFEVDVEATSAQRSRLRAQQR